MMVERSGRLAVETPYLFSCQIHTEDFPFNVAMQRGLFGDIGRL